MLGRTLEIDKLLKKKSFFLFGARSTGKSTLISQLTSETQIYDLLDDETFSSLLRRPALLWENIKKPVVVIDEVQKIPKLLDEVHRILTKHKSPPKFLLTGSSARKLKKGSANLLAGRAWEAHLFPLTSHEIGKDFDLLKYLTRGGLPHIYLSDDYKEELQSYVTLYLREEVQSEARLRNLDLFARFLDLIALSTGEEINFQGFASDCGVSPKTIENYFSILKDTLVGFELPAYTKTKIRKAISRSKFYLFDVGVTGWLCKRGDVKWGSETFGKAFEHFIVSEFRAWVSYQRNQHQLCYWRSLSQHEVDLVVGDLVAVEIKSTDLATERHMKGLRALKEEKLLKRYVLISNDRERRMVDGIEVIPWAEALDELWSGKLISK